MLTLLDFIIRAISRFRVDVDTTKVVLGENVQIRRNKPLTKLLNANAVTIGNTIIVPSGNLMLSTVLHELVHVKQWNDKGAIRFLIGYIKGLKNGPGKHHPMEVDGYAVGDPIKQSGKDVVVAIVP